MTPRRAASGQLQGLEKSAPDLSQSKAAEFKGNSQAESIFDEQKSDAKA